MASYLENFRESVSQTFKTGKDNHNLCSFTRFVGTYAQCQPKQTANNKSDQTTSMVYEYSKARPYLIQEIVCRRTIKAEVRRKEMRKQKFSINDHIAPP
jgi:hypothetical protein